MRLLFEDEELVIHVSKMKDGDVAVITSWGEMISIVGTIVQRYDDRLVILGCSSAEGWKYLSHLTEEGHPNCQVMVLKSGTKLIL